MLEHVSDLLQWFLGDLMTWCLWYLALVHEPVKYIDKMLVKNFHLCTRQYWNFICPCSFLVCLPYVLFGAHYGIYNATAWQKNRQPHHRPLPQSWWRRPLRDQLWVETCCDMLWYVVFCFRQFISHHFISFDFSCDFRIISVISSDVSTVWYKFDFLGGCDLKCWWLGCRGGFLSEFEAIRKFLKVVPISSWVCCDVLFWYFWMFCSALNKRWLLHVCLNIFWDWDFSHFLSWFGDFFRSYLILLFSVTHLPLLDKGAGRHAAIRSAGGQGHLEVRDGLKLILDLRPLLIFHDMWWYLMISHNFPFFKHLKT